jgi:hypothetical protein
MSKYLQHPLSLAFPAMDAEDLEALKTNIHERGQIQPVILYDNMILDGWHRYACCDALGLEVATEPLGEGQDPVAYVQSVNLHRRHLTASQRAQAVVACTEWAPPHRPNKGEVASPLTVSDMAKAADVSERTIQQAKKAQEAGLGEAVRDGKVTAERAAEIAKLPEPERRAAVEAPAPKVAAHKPAPTASDDQDASITHFSGLLAQRDEEIQVLRDKLAETGALLEGAMEGIKSRDRILDAEDLFGAFRNEVQRNLDLALAVRAQNDYLMRENVELAGRLESAQREAKRPKKKTIPATAKGDEINTAAGEGA